MADATVSPSIRPVSFPGITSATGLLALLEEEEDTLKIHALRQLNLVVDQLWFEVSSSISQIEALHEDEKFPARELAGLLASKVFYHLGELQDALTYALGAGEYFNVSEDTEFTQTLVSKCVEQYIVIRTMADQEGLDPVLDPRLEEIVERMLDRCVSENQLEQAIGISIEARRLDKVEEVVLSSDEPSAALAYCSKVAQTLITSKKYRLEILARVVDLYRKQAQPDHVSICQCLMFLDDAGGVADALDALLTSCSDSGPTGVLQACQVAFDLFENEQHQFLLDVKDRLQAKHAPIVESVAAGEGSAGTTEMEMDHHTGPADGVVEESNALSEVTDPVLLGLSRVCGILSGETPIRLGLEFLHSHNKADLGILKAIKNTIDTRNSVCHGAAVLANAIMHAGTTVDQFLRENLDWLSRATNWAKFSATAGLGTIHRGHLAQGHALMAPYLPRDGTSGSPFSEGGALYALGLMHASKGDSIRRFLLDSLRRANNEVVQHGACLGLGLAALGTADEECFEDIKGVLYTDNAIAGEAAGISLGLLLCGRGSARAEEMLVYAHDTQHEKITRGLALGLALSCLGQEETADSLIEQLTAEQDPILRYGSCQAIGLAYRGTGSNAAIRRLLHAAVSDVSDDVRRQAVLSIGFVLCNVPEQCPRIVGLLAESYNSHVRYGAAMAVGISCAGGGAIKEALQLLEPLAGDSIDFVRQGALIAMALVLAQQPESRCKTFRERLDKIITDKHEETMCKMGAIMAAGILDAGGRNCIVQLRSKAGAHRTLSIAGMMVFTQYWYWYPLSFFLCLPLAPSALIAVNSSLEMPKLTVRSNVQPSRFAYPTPVGEEKQKYEKKMTAAILSTTVRAKARKDKAEKDKADREGRKLEESNMKKESSAAMETDFSGEQGEVVKDGTDAEKKEKEPDFEELQNPCRVVQLQQRHISWPEGGRYVPVKPNATSGILVVFDTLPDEKEELVTNITLAASMPATAEDEELEPPAPFEYIPGN